MTITKLRQLIALATSGETTEESHAAALQACRYIKTHGVELRLPNEPGPATAPSRQEGWSEATCDGSPVTCSTCDDPIYPGERYWFRIIKRTTQRLHGGCV